MKKFFTLAVALLLTATAATAQVIGGYKATFKQDISLKGATVITSNVEQGTLYLSDASATKTVEGKAFPIGFEFPFNGQTFSYFGVSAQGLIKLSATESTTMTIDDNFLTTKGDASSNAIFSYDRCAASYAAGNEEGYEPTSISYKSSDDELVVEWKNLGVNTSTWKTALVGTYTLQIHLHKDGTVQYKYAGLSDLTSTKAGRVYLGVRGGDGEYLLWDGFAAEKSYYGETQDFKLSPVVDGHTITLNAPEETVTPAAQPTNLKAEFSYKGSISLGVDYDVAENADKYLVTIATAAPTELPADGKVYAAGDSIGNALVLSAGVYRSGTTYRSDVLKYNTNYTITVYAYNSFGTGGTKYNTVDPLQGQFSTAPEAPGAMKVLSATKNALKLSVAANAADDKIMVVYNDSVFNPENWGNRAYAGVPNASLKAGDYLTYDAVKYEYNEEKGDNDTIYVHDTQAGRVAYFGKAGDFELKDLDASRSYYFIAYSYNETSGKFSQDNDTTQIWTSTHIAVPYEMDLSGAPDSQMPGGWIAAPGDYNLGFNVLNLDARELQSQTEGNRVIFCQNIDKSTTYTLTSPVIELTNANTLSFDWHIHIMGGFGWMQSAAVYEEWDEGDVLSFVLYVDGQKVELKKITSENAPADETESDWHTESFDLSTYAGKDVQFGIEWLGANSATLRLGVENIKVSEDNVDAITEVADDDASAAVKTYNLKGQRVNDNARGVLIKGSQKTIVR